MSVYQVWFDGEYRIVEAADFAAAITAWRDDLLAEWKASGDYSPDDENTEPEQVVTLSDEPVIRGERGDG